jgi:hypothetical protein
MENDVTGVGNRERNTIADGDTRRSGIWREREESIPVLLTM